MNVGFGSFTRREPMFVRPAEMEFGLFTEKSDFSDSRRNARRACNSSCFQQGNDKNRGTELFPLRGDCLCSRPAQSMGDPGDPQLSHSSTDYPFTSSSFPPRVTTMQLLSVTGGSARERLSPSHARSLSSSPGRASGRSSLTARTVERPKPSGSWSFIALD